MKNKSKLIWAAINGTAVFMLYEGLHNGVNGAQNLLWLYIIINVIEVLAWSTSGGDNEVANRVIKTGFAAPYLVTQSLSIIMLVSFVWYGWFFASVVFLVKPFVYHVWRTRINKIVRQIKIDGEGNKNPC